MFVLWLTVVDVPNLFRQIWDGKRHKMEDNENRESDCNYQHPNHPQISNHKAAENRCSQKGDAIRRANKAISLVSVFFRHKNSYERGDGDPAQVTSDCTEQCQDNKQPEVEAASNFKHLTRCGNKNQAGKDIKGE